MRRFAFLAVLLLLASAFAQQPPAQPTAAAPAPPTAPALPGFDINALDRAADPCVNFYQFACGAWMRNHPVPADQTRWGRFDILQQHNRDLLRGILEAAAAPAPARSPLESKIGDYYASCMDEAAIEQLGTKPISAELARLATVSDRAGLIDAVAHLNASGVRAVFSFYPTADLHDATRMIANLDQGGLSLPDRDYYLKTDAKSVETRQKFTEHVTRMFRLLGDDGAQAKAEGAAVLALETQLARAAMDRVLRRDPAARDHRMSTAQIAGMAPNLDFPRYFAALPAPEFQGLNVANPAFFVDLNNLLDSVPLADWKTYLRWRLLSSTAALLPAAFVNEQFDFDNRFMGGARELEPRWLRCVKHTDSELGEALGQLYVERSFGAGSRAHTLEMVTGIEQAMGDDINQLDWMAETTKQAAHAKLAKVGNNIGYPVQWRDYGKFEVVRGDAMGNHLRGLAFEFARQMAKIGQPVDRREWSMTPPTVNAYYNPSRNDINFPAGILQPPFFDPQMDDAINYGGIGAVIGHELTHGFDDQGAKYDGDGNLRDWWEPADLAEFQKRSACLADEYSQFVAVDDVHLDGRLTLGENTADNGGVRLAYRALMKRLEGQAAASLDGFTPEQRFFLGYAQIWCQNVTPQAARLRAKTDPHSPGEFRVNGVVVNSAEFQKAFGCKATQPMVAAHACRTW
jgi:endothelin-converting enzyme/putative endopeptidase